MAPDQGPSPLTTGNLPASRHAHTGGSRLGERSLAALLWLAALTFGSLFYGPSFGLNAPSCFDFRRAGPWGPSHGVALSLGPFLGRPRPPAFADERKPNLDAPADSGPDLGERELCPQAAPLVPSSHRALDDGMERLLAGEAYRRRAYGALGGAVRIPTVSSDDLGPVGEDPRWDVFADLHEYLERTYPRVFASLDVTKVNTYGIVLHWQGTDESALPVLMTAHQDVVPVDPSTHDEWEHLPFSGFYDGTWIWGRGSCDDKSDLVAALQAIDALLSHDFKPSRTFVWAFGFDEESSGTQGAGQLAPYLENRYGRDGFALLIDEGGKGYGREYGGDVIFAFPALSEKGYLDVRIELTAPGGHSSVPPAHTAIGMLAALITELEAHPHPAVLTRTSSAYRSTQCAAAHAPEYPAELRRLARAAVHSDAALEELRDALLGAEAGEAALLRTTQAVDVVMGGVKVNALPERAGALVNLRIVESSSVADVEARLTSTLPPLAKRFDLSMESFGGTVEAGTGEAGHLSLSVAFGYQLDPSPVTPSGPDDPYQVLAGTIRGLIASEHDRNETSGLGVVVIPRIEVGNTDTSRYWNLTRNIVRYSHIAESDRYNGFHTVNEAIRAEGWLGSVRFYTRFMLNCDEYL